MVKLKTQTKTIIAILLIVSLFMFVGKKEATYVQFRSYTDIYGVGGAIALAETCGDELTAYGYASQSFYDCAADEIILTTNECYFVCRRDSYPDRLYVEKPSGWAYYLASDSDASKVSTSRLSINPDLEVTCISEETCVPTSWTPDPSTICSGESFLQLSNCETIRQSIGTKDCGEIICSVVLDCGVAGYSGDNYCSEGNVVKDFINYVCNNPGTTSSYCTEDSEPRIMMECSYGCDDLGLGGVCLPPSNCNTPADTDCNGEVNDIELLSYASKWLNNEISDLELLEAASAWLGG